MALDLKIEITGAVVGDDDSRVFKFYTAIDSEPEEGFIYFFNDLGDKINFITIAKNKFTYDPITRRSWYQIPAKQIYGFATAAGYDGIDYYAGYTPVPVIIVTYPENKGVVLNLDLTHRRMDINDTLSVNIEDMDASPVDPYKLERGYTPPINTTNVTNKISNLSVFPMTNIDIASGVYGEVISHGIFVYSKWVKRKQRIVNMFDNTKGNTGIAFRFSGHPSKTYRAIIRLGLPDNLSETSKVEIAPIFSKASKLENMVRFSKSHEPAKKARTKYRSGIDLGNASLDPGFVINTINTSLPAGTTGTIKNSLISKYNAYGLTTNLIAEITSIGVSDEVETELNELHNALDITNYYFVDHIVEDIHVNDDGYGTLQLMPLMTSTTMTNYILSGIVIAEEIDWVKPFVKDCNPLINKADPVSRQFILAANENRPVPTRSFVKDAYVNSCGREIAVALSRTNVDFHAFIRPMIVMEYQSTVVDPEDNTKTLWKPFRVVRVPAGTDPTVYFDESIITQDADLRLFDEKPGDTTLYNDKFHIRAYLIDDHDGLSNINRLYTPETFGTVTKMHRNYISYPRYTEYAVIMTKYSKDATLILKKVTCNTDKSYRLECELELRGSIGVNWSYPFMDPSLDTEILVKAFELFVMSANGDPGTKELIKTYTVADLIDPSIAVKISTATQAGIAVYEIVINQPATVMDKTAAVFTFGQNKKWDALKHRCIVNPCSLSVDCTDNRDINAVISHKCFDKDNIDIFVDADSNNPDMIYEVKNKVGVLIDHGDLPRDPNTKEVHWSRRSYIPLEGITTTIIRNKTNPVKKLSKIVTPSCAHLADVTFHPHLECHKLTPTDDKCSFMKITSDVKAASREVTLLVTMNDGSVAHHSVLTKDLSGNQYVNSVVFPIVGYTSLTYRFYLASEPSVYKEETVLIDCADKRVPIYLLDRQCTGNGRSVVNFTLDQNSCDTYVTLEGLNLAGINEVLYYMFAIRHTSLTRVDFPIPPGFKDLKYTLQSINNPVISVTGTTTLDCLATNPLSYTSVTVTTDHDEGTTTLTRDPSGPEFSYTLTDQSGNVIGTGSLGDVLGNSVTYNIYSPVDTVNGLLISLENPSVTTSYTDTVDLVDHRTPVFTVTTLATGHNVKMKIARPSGEVPFTYDVFDSSSTVVASGVIDMSMGVEKLYDTFTVHNVIEETYTVVATSIRDAVSASKSVSVDTHDVTSISVNPPTMHHSSGVVTLEYSVKIGSPPVNITVKNSAGADCIKLTGQVYINDPSLGALGPMTRYGSFMAGPDTYTVTISKTYAGSSDVPLTWTITV